MLIFGPVPSRRLGRSLGINNIPPKSCSYSCVYCQVGLTDNTEIVPRPFYTPDQIFVDVQSHVERLLSKDERIDYLTFVPDGEPTLDSRLAETIDRLRPLGIPIAVISNASLIWNEEVRKTLMHADWVSLKVDAIEEDLWRRINRPHPALDHQVILDGMRAFAHDFKGALATETMLVRGLNDDDEAATAMAGFLEKLGPAVAYLSIPTRPPAEKDVHAPDEAVLNRVFQIISRKISVLELNTGYEGNAFASTGNVVEDLLSITSVHPMREEAVKELLSKTKADWNVVEQLIEKKELMQTQYEGKKFYVRRFKH